MTDEIIELTRVSNGYNGSGGSGHLPSTELRQAAARMGCGRGPPARLPGCHFPPQVAHCQFFDADLYLYTHFNPGISQNLQSILIH